MAKITVYEKPTCTTCRKVLKTLNENGVNFEKVNYYVEPFSKTKLQSLLKKMKMKPSEVLRKKEKVYKYGYYSILYVNNFINKILNKNDSQIIK